MKDLPFLRATLSPCSQFNSRAVEQAAAATTYLIGGEKTVTSSRSHRLEVVSMVKLSISGPSFFHKEYQADTALAPMGGRITESQNGGG